MTSEPLTFAGIVLEPGRQWKLEACSLFPEGVQISGGHGCNSTCSSKERGLHHRHHDISRVRLRPLRLILTKQVEHLKAVFFVVGEHEQAVRAGGQEPVVGSTRWDCRAETHHFLHFMLTFHSMAVKRRTSKSFQSPSQLLHLQSTDLKFFFVICEGGSDRGID